MGEEGGEEEYQKILTLIKMKMMIIY